MSHQLRFSELYQYDLSESSISIPVTLGYSKRQTTVDAKLDTGASYCIFQRFLGEDLGLNIESGYRQGISTATGSFVAYGHTVTLSVLGKEFDAMVFFAAEETFSRNVLGRAGCLNQLRVGIVDYEGKLYLARFDE